MSLFRVGAFRQGGAVSSGVPARALMRAAPARAMAAPARNQTSSGYSSLLKMGFVGAGAVVVAMTGASCAPSSNMEDDIEQVLYSREAISLRVKEMGAEISRDFKGKEVVLVGVLTGCLPFLADLMREISIPVTVDFISASSYQGTKSTGSVVITRAMYREVKDKHVIIVEDIVDTGRTIVALAERLLGRGAASVTFCTMFDKKARRVEEVPGLKYVGFSFPEDHFVVGYGMDYDQEYRHLAYVGALKREAIGRK